MHGEYRVSTQTEYRLVLHALDLLGLSFVSQFGRCHNDRSSWGLDSGLVTSSDEYSDEYSEEHSGEYSDE